MAVGMPKMRICARCKKPFMAMASDIKTPHFLLKESLCNKCQMLEMKETAEDVVGAASSIFKKRK